MTITMQASKTRQLLEAVAARRLRLRTAFRWVAGGAVSTAVVWIYAPTSTLALLAAGAVLTVGLRRLRVALLEQGRVFDLRTK
jgi:hypothetical protein